MTRKLVRTTPDRTGWMRSVQILRSTLELVKCRWSISRQSFTDNEVLPVLHQLYTPLKKVAALVSSFDFIRQAVG